MSAAEAIAVAAEYQAAIFFDNDFANAEDVSIYCPNNMNSILVRQTPGSEHPEQLWEQEPLASYIAGLGDNKMVTILRSLAADGVEGMDRDAYDVLSGISDIYITICNKWEANTRGTTPRAAIFDWDRTLTKFEGVFRLFEEAQMNAYLAGPGKKFETLGITKEEALKDYVIYLFGGEERLRKIRDMMRSLKENGVDIFILTNNGSCRADGYQVIVKEFFADIPYTIICSKELPFRGHKGQAMRGQARFKVICPPPVRRWGGGSTRTKRGTRKGRKGKKRTLRRRR